MKAKKRLSQSLIKNILKHNNNTSRKNLIIFSGEIEIYTKYVNLFEKLYPLFGRKDVDYNHVNLFNLDIDCELKSTRISPGNILNDIEDVVLVPQKYKNIFKSFLNQEDYNFDYYEMKDFILSKSDYTKLENALFDYFIAKKIFGTVTSYDKVILYLSGYINKLYEFLVEHNVVGHKMFVECPNYVLLKYKLPRIFSGKGFDQMLTMLSSCNTYNMIDSDIYYRIAQCKNHINVNESVFERDFNDFVTKKMNEYKNVLNYFLEIRKEMEFFENGEIQLLSLLQPPYLESRLINIIESLNSDTTDKYDQRTIKPEEKQLLKFLARNGVPIPIDKI